MIKKLLKLCLIFLAFIFLLSLAFAQSIGNYQFYNYLPSGSTAETWVCGVKTLNGYFCISNDYDYGILFDSNGNILDVKQYDVSNGAGQIEYFMYDEDDNYIIVVGREGVHIFDGSTLSKIKELQLGGKAVGIDIQNNILYSVKVIDADGDGTTDDLSIEKYDYNGNLLENWTFYNYPNFPIEAIYDPQSSLLFVGLANNKLLVFDTATGQIKYVKQYSTATSSYVYNFYLYGDYLYLAYTVDGYTDGKVQRIAMVNKINGTIIKETADILVGTNRSIAQWASNFIVVKGYVLFFGSEYDLSSSNLTKYIHICLFDKDLNLIQCVNTTKQLFQGWEGNLILDGSYVIGGVSRESTGWYYIINVKVGTLTVVINSPQAGQTIYVSQFNVNFTVNNDGDTNVSSYYEVYLDGNLIYNKTATFLIGHNNYTEILESFKEGSHTIEVKAYDPEIEDYVSDSVTINLDLYDENVTYSNFTEYNSSKYIDTLNYKIEVRCGALNYNITIDAFNNRNYTVICDNSTKVIEDSFRFESEGNKTVWFYLNAVNSSDSRYFGNETFIVDLEPPDKLLISFNFTYGFRKNISENVTFSVHDSISPVQYCDIRINSQTYQNVTFQNNQTTYTIELMDGINVFEITCKDLLGHKATNYTNQKIYLRKFILVEEDTGNIFNSFSDMDTLRAISENTQEIFDFLQNNDTQIYFVSSNVDTIRIEKRYVQNPNDLLYIDLNLDLIPNETRICIARPQTFYEAIFYSSANKPIAVLNNLGQCYVLADYTKYAYQDALMAKSYTIKALYYLYTYQNGQKVFLSTLDGSVATSVALDVLESTKKQYIFSLTTDDLSINKFSNQTLKIYYKNLNEDNKEINIKIYDGDRVVFDHTETENPNEFTLYFDYSSIDIKNDLLKIAITKIKEDGSTQTISKFFNLDGASGIIHPYVAIMIACVLVFFGLTLVAKRYLFSWFGLIILTSALAITTLAVQTSEIRFMQVLIIIMLFYIGLVYKEEYPSIT